MEYQNIINLLGNRQNEPSKFRKRICVEINYESRGTYNVSNQVEFKNSVRESHLCYYSDAYIHLASLAKWLGVLLRTNCCGIKCRCCNV